MIIRIFILLLCTTIAHAQSADSTPPIIKHTVITSAVKLRPLEIKAEIIDQHAVYEPKVFYRLPGQKDFAAKNLVKSGNFYTVTLPIALVKVDLEYFIEAFDEYGNGPARHGSPAQPHRIVKLIKPVLTPTFGDKTETLQVEGAFAPPRKEQKQVHQDNATGCQVEPKPIHCEWWFWTIIGASVAVAAGTTAGILLNNDSDTHMYGSRSITVIAPDPR